MTYLLRYSGNLPVYIWAWCQHGMSKVQAAVKPPCHLEHLTHCFQLGVTIMMNEDFPGVGCSAVLQGFEMRPLSLLKNCIIYLQLYWVFIAAHGLFLVVKAGATLLWSAWASHWGAQALGAQAQQFLHTSFVVPLHVGSSWTRDQTCVPFIGRQILNHWTTTLSF